MRICVVGAGAIGGLLGAKLALADNEVTLFDQGAHLEAIKRNGLKAETGSRGLVIVDYGHVDGDKAYVALVAGPPATGAANSTRP